MKEPQHISATELRDNLREVLDEVEDGEEFIVERRGEPVATLQPPKLAARPGVLSDEEIEAIKSQRKATAAQALGAGRDLWASDEEFEDFVHGIDERREAARRRARGEGA